MQGWLTKTIISIKLTFRDRQVIFWNYLFPLFFVFLFCGVFAKGSAQGTALMMPGLLCISAMAASFFGLSIDLVAARERGILRRFQMTPIHPWAIISSELVASFIVAFSTMVLQLALAIGIYKLQIAGNWLVLLLTTGFGTLMFLSFGFIIASLAENTKAAQVMSNLCYFPLLFLGGAAFPMEFLPKTFQQIAQFLPTQYMIVALRKIIVGGEGLGAVLPNLALMGIVFLVALGVAARFFRWESGRGESQPLFAE